MSDLFDNLFSVDSDLFEATARELVRAAHVGDRVAFAMLGLRTSEDPRGLVVQYSSGLLREMERTPGNAKYLIAWVSILARRLAKMTAEERLQIRDEMMAQRDITATGLEPSCRKGCASCCHVEVTVTRDEAEVLAGLVREGIVEIDHARLEAQAAHDDTEAYAEDVKNARCVFLSDKNECGVYEHRPMACRAYTVVGDPVLCDWKVNPSGKVAVIIDSKTEVLQTALRHAVASDPLPKMLKKEFSRRPLYAPV